MKRTLSLSMLFLLSACASSEPPAQQIQLGPEGPQTLDSLELVVQTSAGGAYGGAYGQDSVNLDYSLEIRWTAEGVAVPELNDERSVPAELTRKGQLWSAQVRAVSGELAGPTASEELRILNTPPSTTLNLEAVPTAEMDLITTPTLPARSA